MKKYKVKSPAVLDELEYVCVTTRLPKSAMIELALLKLFGSENDFIKCPTCGKFLAVKSAIDTNKQIRQYKCICRTKVFYDTYKCDIVGVNKFRK